MSLPAPFGKYELLDQIGSGGMADVFLARSFGVAGFEKRLVIKRIKPEHARDPRFVSLFIHEAKIGVHLNHPNIVQVYELGKVGESWYIAMEHLHGRDLNRVVRSLRAREERMPPAMAVRIVAETLRGLAHAHGADGGDDRVGLVHRDVSPHNLFLTFAGEVKLVDFGIARMLDGRRPAEESEARPGGGKYAYMSPEQASGTPIDHRSDLFSAGVVLWELLVGQRLYGGADADDKLRRVREAVVPDPADLDVALEPALADVLRRALARSPDDRYESAAAFEEDLRAWLYDHRARAGADALAGLLRDLFPTASRHDPAALDLRRLADDIRRLDAEDGGTTTGTGSEQPGGTPSAGTGTPGHTPLHTVLRAAGDERKRVVALVVDVDGFTGISERAEPEVLFKRHLQMLRWLRRAVDAHGGVLQHVHDDQAYVLFGIPRTRTDDLQRALDCALELHRRLPELHEQGVGVQLAVGVHTGDVTVGHAGSRLRYMARGDTTRLARRLSEQADHGEVIASEAILRAAEGAYRFQRGPWLLGRGGRPPVGTYRLQGRREGMGHRRGAWLKRADELDVIRDALVQLGEGQGAAVLVHGEAGAGKTRLVHEVWEAARRRRLAVRHGQATPFGHPLAALRGVLLDVLGLTAATTDEDIREHVDRFRQLGLFPRDLEALEVLLGIASGRVDTSEMWNAVRRALGALSASEPFAVILEDLHHLPARELERLVLVVERLADTRILWLLTHEGDPPEGLAALATTVALGPLAPSLQRRLAASVLGVATVDDALAELLARSSEGNPLYVEELASYLDEHDRIRREGEVATLVGTADESVPDTLAAILAARIDALDPASKGALQIAAVIGDRFDIDLLGEVIGMDDPVPIVTDLAAHGLIEGAGDRDRWRFASELIRQATLRGILGVQRRDYHRLVADALERRVGRSSQDLSGLLAEHCGYGGRYLDAARYAYAAGRRHEDAQELDTARDAYKRGLRWLAEVEERPDVYDARVQGEAMLRVRLGAVSLLLGETRTGMASLRVALDVAEDAGLPWLEVRAHLELGRHLLEQGDLPRSRAHLGQAAALVRIQRDRTLEVEVLEALAQLEHAAGSPDDAAARWNDALDRAGEDAALRARCLVGLANVHLRTGQLDTAEPLLDEALEAARVSEDRILEGRVLNNLGLLHVFGNEPDDAVRLFRRALQVREDIGYQQGVVINHHNIGDVHFMRGDLTRAGVSFQRSREVAEDMGWRRGMALNDVYLGYIDGRRGDGDGLERIRAATTDARSFGDFEIAISGQWLEGRLLAHAGRDDEARARLEEALGEAERRQLGHLGETIRQDLNELGKEAPGA